MTRTGVVIPTLGRGRLPELLASLAAQSAPPSQVVIVDQSADGLPQPTTSLAVTVVRRPPGLSAARNEGVRHLTDWDCVVFADDDTTWAPEALAAVLRRIELGAAIVCARITTGGATRVPFPPAAQRLDRHSVWRAAMEPGLAASREAWRTVGGFDESLGLGSPTPWQSGEGTDLLLRAIDADLPVWFDPAVDVTEWPAADASPVAAADKARRYARGTGRVYALRYGPAGRARLVARTAGRFVRHLLPPRRAALAVDWQVALGRLEGLAGAASSRHAAHSPHRGRGSAE